MVHARANCHEDHLCHIILKFNHAKIKNIQNGGHQQCEGNVTSEEKLS